MTQSDYLITDDPSGTGNHTEQADPAPYSISINTSSHTMTLFKNGKRFKTYPVAVG